MKALPLEAKNITKHFGAVLALDGVGLTVQKGECLAVVGENGAGKSTLMKILAGVERPDNGQLLLGGHPTHITGPRHSRDLGICLIHQELQIVPKMSVVENIFLGREETRTGFLPKKWELAQAETILRQLGLAIDLRQPMYGLSVAEQQMVEIAKGLAQDAELVIMDEPTAALAPPEVERLFGVIRVLLKSDKAVIYISHRIDEIGEVANRVLVLRDGRVAGELPGGASSRDVVTLMIGRDIDQLYPRAHRQEGDVALEVRSLFAPRLEGIDFELRHGEILGLGGLVGAGQRELADVLFGRTRPTAGEIYVRGRRLLSLTPAQAIGHGIAFMGEDRRREGLNMKGTVEDNITLPILNRTSRLGFVSLSDLTRRAVHQMKSLHIRATSSRQQIPQLSGGNQQKVVLARAVVCEPDILILVEPTRGVDVGAKVEIYELLDRFAADGKAIVLVSSDLNELQGMSDRIIILYQGRVAGRLARPEITRERLSMLATGQQWAE